MSYNVKTTSVFEKQAQKLFKKYPSLKFELLELVQKLQQNPAQGIAIGQHCYKIRMAISSKGKGKSGGARIITYVVLSEANVYLLTIYDKSEKTNISQTELKELLVSLF